MTPVLFGNASHSDLPGQFKKNNNIPVLYRPYDDALAKQGKDWYYYAETAGGRAFTYPVTVITLEFFASTSKNFKVIYFDYDEFWKWIVEDGEKLATEAMKNEEYETINAMADLLSPFPMPPWDKMQVRLIRDEELFQIFNFVYSHADGALTDKGETKSDSLNSQVFAYRKLASKEETEEFLEFQHQYLVTPNNKESGSDTWGVAVPESYNKRLIPFNAERGQGGSILDMMKPPASSELPTKELQGFIADAIDDTLAFFRVCNYIHSLVPREYDPESVIHHNIVDLNNRAFKKQQKILEKRVVKLLRGGVTKTIYTGDGTKHDHRYDVRGHHRFVNGKITWVKPHERGIHFENKQEVQYAITENEQKTVVKKSFFDKTRIVFMEKNWKTPIKKVWIFLMRRIREYIPLHPKSIPPPPLTP